MNTNRIVYVPCTWSEAEQGHFIQTPEGAIPLKPLPLEEIKQPAPGADAIAFANWIWQNSWYYDSEISGYPWKHRKTHEVAMTQDLYRFFLQSLDKSQSQPAGREVETEPAEQWETKKHPLSGTWAVMHRKEGFTTDFDLYYATSQVSADRLKSLLNASEGDSVEFAEWTWAHECQWIYVGDGDWAHKDDINQIIPTADLYTQFKNQKEGR